MRVIGEEEKTVNKRERTGKTKKTGAIENGR